MYYTRSPGGATYKYRVGTATRYTLTLRPFIIGGLGDATHVARRSLHTAGYPPDQSSRKSDEVDAPEEKKFETGRENFKTVSFGQQALRGQ